MSTATIPQLPSGSAIGGTEPFETVQGGVSVQVPASALATYILGLVAHIPSAASPSAVAGPNAINGAASTFMRSDASPAIQKASNTQLGLAQGDGTTIVAVAGVFTAIGGGGGGTPANPTATAGPTAINGSASTYMRSDAAPAVQKGSASQFGIMQADGTSITAPGGVLSAVSQGLSVTTTSSTSLSPVLGDANGWKRFSAGTAITYTIPTNASVAFPIGTTLSGEQIGSGIIHIVAAGGVTLNSANSLFHSNGQFSVFELTKVGTDEWTLFGNLVT